MKAFSVRFDERTKQILVALLDRAIQETSQVIVGGEYGDEVLNQHEELVQVKSGILYTRPEEIEEATEDTKEETPEEMYKSQEGRQS